MWCDAVKRGGWEMHRWQSVACLDAAWWTQQW